MKLHEVNGAAVRREIKKMKDAGIREFRTRDVSDNCLADHGFTPTRHPWDYHARIGNYLSRHDTELGIFCPDKGQKHPNGVLWILRT